MARKTLPKPTKRRGFVKRKGIRINRRGQKVHYFKRTRVDEFTISTPASVGTYFTPVYSDVSDTVYNNFRLNQMPGYTDFTAMYDTYKINGIKQKFVFDVNSSEVGGNGVYPNGFPSLVTVNDFNDTAALSSEDEALQYETYKSRRLLKPITRYFKPTMTDNTGGSVSNVIRRRWTPTSEPDIAHMGLKVAYTGYNFEVHSKALGRMRVYTTYYVGFMTPK